jgi:geranylgeranyl pyrophosphate synthase
MRDVFTGVGLHQRLSALRAVVDLPPGIEYALERARTLVDEARARIETLPQSRARDALCELGGYVLERSW